MTPVYISAIRNRCAHCLIGLLGLVAYAEPMLGQSRGSVPNCTTILSARDAARCIGSERPNAPIPMLDPKHTYTLAELIDIAEMESPVGPMAWATPKASLARHGR